MSEKPIIVKNIYDEDIPLYFLDYETYFSKDFTLKKLTTIEYVRDPRFKAHGAAIIDPWGKEQWVTGKDLPDFFASVDWSKNGLASHHANFDQFITSQIYGVVPAYNVCTMFMSYGEFGSGRSGSLQALSKRLGLVGKQEGVLESTMDIRDLSPEMESTLSEYAIQDVEMCREAFKLMYYSRGYPEQEMHVIDLTIRMFTDPVLQIDSAMCRAEIAEEDLRIQNLLNSDIIKDAKLSSKCLSILQARGIEGLMRSRPCFAELLLSRGIYPPMKNKVKNGEVLADEFTYAFAKNDIELITLGDDPRVSDLVAVWTGTKSSIRKTRAERFLAASENGTKPFPMPLIYAGARTNRWSGRGTSLNVQNMPSGRDGRGSRLRQSIIAPKGWRIAAPDLSQVELRCSAWIADEKELLHDLANNLDPYSKTASEIYGVTVDKKGPYAHYRHVGKEAELSLSYGVGWKKFYHTIQTKYGNQVGDFTEEDAQRTVDLYRKKRVGILSVWDAFKEYLPMMVADMVKGDEYKIWRIYKDKILTPSNLYMHYQDLQWKFDKDIRRGNYIYLHGKEYAKIYPQKMYENAIQSMARDIIAHQMVQIAKEFRVLGTVHDEILVLVPEQEADAALEWCLDIMRKPPEWCATLPLDAEGKHSHCYAK